MEHTPTPWKISNGSDRLIYGGADGERWVASAIGRDGRGISDAAFIVRAVNLHDTLLKAVTDTQDVLAEYIVPDSGISEMDCVNRLLGILDHQDLVRAIRAALAKATA